MVSFSHTLRIMVTHFHGFVQDYGNSIPKALELLQSCAEPSVCPRFRTDYLFMLSGISVTTGDLLWTNQLQSGWINPTSPVVLAQFFNTLGPEQNGRFFADDVFKCIFLNENVWILLKISLKFVPKGPINHIPSLVQIMAWRRTGDKS